MALDHYRRRTGIIDTVSLIHAAQGIVLWSWLADSINSERQLQIILRLYVLKAPKSRVFFRFGKPAPE
jgi:hypothetical protein